MKAAYSFYGTAVENAEELAGVHLVEDRALGELGPLEGAVRGLTGARAELRRRRAC